MKRNEDFVDVEELLAQERERADHDQFAWIVILGLGILGLLLCCGLAVMLRPPVGW